jgi:hypothetical protein
MKMSLYNLIGNRVYDWGAVELKEGMNRFDCSRIVASRDIYFLHLNGENIHSVSKILISP